MSARGLLPASFPRMKRIYLAEGLVVGVDFHTILKESIRTKLKIFGRLATFDLVGTVCHWNHF